MAHCPSRADAFSAGFVFNVCSSVWIFAFAAVGRAPPSWAAPFRGVLKGFGRSLREENLLCGTRGSPSRAQGPRPPNGCDVGSPRAPRSGPAGLSCSRPGRCGPQSAAAAPGRPVWTGRTSGHTLPRGAAQMPTECRTRTGSRSVSEDRHGQTSLPPVRGAAGREAEAPPQSPPLGHVEGEHGGAGCGGLDRGARRVVASPQAAGRGTALTVSGWTDGGGSSTEASPGVGFAHGTCSAGLAQRRQGGWRRTRPAHSVRRRLGAAAGEHHLRWKSARRYWLSDSPFLSPPHRYSFNSLGNSFSPFGKEQRLGRRQRPGSVSRASDLGFQRASEPWQVIGV